jgi:hypothetical protein
MLQAIDARKLVGQAMGILMERFDLDGDRAFEVLKRYSQDNNLKTARCRQSPRPHPCRRHVRHWYGGQQASADRSGDAAHLLRALPETNSP